MVSRPPLRRLLSLLLVLIMFLPLRAAVPVKAAPVAPTLTSPLDGSTTTYENYTPTGTPTLEWEAVPGAIMYNIQICPSYGCSNPTISEYTYATRYTCPVALTDGWWYWHVQAFDSSGWGPYSSVWSFQKSWMNFGALPVVLTEPAAGATVEFFEHPYFSWSPIPGTARYLLQIYYDSSCSVIRDQYDTIKPTYTPANRLPRGNYYWRVVPVDYRTHYGTPSECRGFYMDYQQVPGLLTPADETDQLFTPEFRWLAVKGAYYYNLQYSTDPLFQSNVTNVVTNNPHYTPESTLPNDQDYYWRVAAVDTTNTAGPWSETRHFVMAWHLRPRLLSPTLNYVYVPFPVFQWTPVAGANLYRIIADEEAGYPSPRLNQTLADPRLDFTGWGIIYGNEFYNWHIRAEDPYGNGSLWSQDYAFQYETNPAPTLIYPPFYYDPEVVSSTHYLDVRTDPTVPLPLFMWDRVVQVDSSIASDSYVIEVDDEATFSPPLAWTATTDNLSVAPSVENPFTMTAGTVYYWRVMAYRGGNPMSTYSEVWQTRFDPSLQAVTSTLVPYFPMDGLDSVYDTPLLGWSSLQGAAQYDLQISRFSDFSTIEYEAHPSYNFFCPTERLVPETYYWRVQAQDAGGSPIGDWSTARRLVVTYPMRVGDPDFYALSHPILNEPYTQIGSDSAGDVDTAYDLTGLYIARDDNPAPQNSYFYITIDLPYTNTTDMYFGFYIDLDHAINSGGSTDPMGFQVQTNSTNRPELVIYAHHISGAISAATLYRWIDGSYWEGPIDLSYIGGGVSYRRGHYLELRIPSTEIDQGLEWLGTVSMEVFAAPYLSQVVDTVPPESTTPTGSLTNFTAVADKLNLLEPWDNPHSNPFIKNVNPILSFAKPLFYSYVQGYQVQIDRDDRFTPPYVHEEGWYSGTPLVYFFLGTRYTRWNSTYEENNSLYWRIRLVHRNGYGPWSQPMRFTKVNYKPVNMSADYTYTTPTFQWDRVEGATATLLEVNRDANFQGEGFSVWTQNPSYTYPGSLRDGTWYWRLKSRDSSLLESSNTAVQVFTKTSEAPPLVSPIGGAVVHEIPTMEWEDILYPQVEPVVNSSRYRLLIDDNPNFSSPYLQDLDTNSVTPPSSVSFQDGTYYWKVAMLDRAGNLGPYSDVGIFYKSYLTPTIVSATFDPIPDLTWLPVDGAAAYQVQICLDQYYGNCPDTILTDNTNYVSTRNYAAGVYYWRVRMCDVTGVCGPFYEDRVASGYLVYLPVVFKNHNP